MLKQQTPPILPSLLILPSPLNPLNPLSPLSFLNPLSFLISLSLLSLLISPTGGKNKQKNAKNNFFIIFAHIQKTRNL